MIVIDFLRKVLSDREEYDPGQDPIVQRAHEVVQESQTERVELRDKLGKTCPVNFYEEALFPARNQQRTPT